ncbi:MAG: hypothetical protein GY842_19055 [bacterium]|nr:hypothetical protein [bacterium]
MPLSSITMGPPQPDAQSLALTVRALLLQAGGDVPYETLNVALGLSFMTSVRDPQRCLACWMTEGRDAFLAATAPRFGLRLRGLHPPQAAVGLSTAPGFDQHFQASYRPLILRALENDQPVIVHGVWTGDRTPSWGLLTAEADGGVGLLGMTPALAGSPLALSVPPVQAYIVEDVRPQLPSDREVLHLALRHARAVLGNQLDDQGNLTTGPDVYTAWSERLRDAQVCAACGSTGARCHSQAARTVSAARESGVNFLLAERGGMSETAAAVAERIIAECREVCATLSRSGDHNAVEGLLETDVGCAELRHDLDTVREHEIRIGLRVAELCTELAL